MATHKSAEKRARQGLRRAKKNTNVKSRVKTFEKKLLGAIGTKNVKEAQKLLTSFASEIDRAAQKGVVHVKRAARRVSRLSKQISQLSK